MLEVICTAELAKSPQANKRSMLRTILYPDIPTPRHPDNRCALVDTTSCMYRIDLAGAIHTRGRGLPAPVGDIGEGPALRGKGLLELDAAFLLLQALLLCNQDVQQVGARGGGRDAERRPSIPVITVTHRRQEDRAPR